MTAKIAPVISLDDRRVRGDGAPCCLPCAVLNIANRLGASDALLIPVDVLATAAADLRAEVDRAQRRAEELARARAEREQDTP